MFASSIAKCALYNQKKSLTYRKCIYWNYFWIIIAIFCLFWWIKSFTTLDVPWKLQNFINILLKNNRQNMFISWFSHQYELKYDWWPFSMKCAKFQDDYPSKKCFLGLICVRYEFILSGEKITFWDGCKFYCQICIL